MLGHTAVGGGRRRLDVDIGIEALEQLSLFVLKGENLLLKLGHALVAAETVFLSSETVAFSTTLLGCEKEGARAGSVGIDGAAGGGGVAGGGRHVEGERERVS